MLKVVTKIGYNIFKLGWIVLKFIDYKVTKKYIFVILVPSRRINWKPNTYLLISWSFYWCLDLKRKPQSDIVIVEDKEKNMITSLFHICFIRCVS